MLQAVSKQTNSYSKAQESPIQIATRLAKLSEKLLPTMEQHALKMSFEPLTPGGVCIADATCNPTSAYKARGALASACIAKQHGAEGVWTASAGNHGAGLAYAAKLLGLDATIYVPTTAPQTKVQNINKFGARVRQLGRDFDSCLKLAHECQNQSSSSTMFVHPFDEQAVVAGQGTIGFEIIRHAALLSTMQDFDRIRIFVPIGGGGLTAGIASVLKTQWPTMLPRPEIIAVADESSPSSVVGALFGRPVRTLSDTIADGIRVAKVGKTFASVAPLLDHILLIPHDEIVTTMQDMEHLHGRRLEPAGALAIAGERLVRRHALLPEIPGSLSIPVISGSNVDLDTFSDTLRAPRRINTTSHQRCAFDIPLKERDGELLSLLRTVSNFNIASLTYKQNPEACTSTLRIEFEILRGSIPELERTVGNAFPGSERLTDGTQVAFSVTAPVAQDFRDDLVTLTDRPGAFLEYLRELHTQDELGSIGFLFYRKPAKAGALAQVVLGRRIYKSPCN